MTWTTWVIIGLLIISFYQYSNPAKANEMLNPVWGQVKEFIDNKNPLSQTSKDSPCPDTDEPVCADGTTYKNSCEAALDGKIQVTAGAC